MTPAASVRAGHAGHAGLCRHPRSPPGTPCTPPPPCAPDTPSTPEAPCTRHPDTPSHAPGRTRRAGDAQHPGHPSTPTPRSSRPPRWRRSVSPTRPVSRVAEGRAKYRRRSGDRVVGQSSPPRDPPVHRNRVIDPGTAGSDDARSRLGLRRVVSTGPDRRRARSPQDKPHGPRFSRREAWPCASGPPSRVRLR